MDAHGPVVAFEGVAVRHGAELVFVALEADVEGAAGGVLAVEFGGVGGVVGVRDGVPGGGGWVGGEGEEEEERKEEVQGRGWHFLRSRWESRFVFPLQWWLGGFFEVLARVVL
jgi:hypothetical protein